MAEEVHKEAGVASVPSIYKPAALTHRSTTSRSFFTDDSARDSRQQGPVLPPYVIHPQNRYYLIYWHLSIILVIYAAIMSPFRFAFYEANDRRSEVIVKVDYVVDCIFMLDIIISFNVAIQRHGLLVYRRAAIAYNYLRKNFVFDLVGSLPWELMFRQRTHLSTNTNSNGKPSARALVLLSLGLLRLIRMRRLARLFKSCEEDIRFHYFAIRLLKFLALVLFVGHFMACYFFFLSTLADNPDYTWIGDVADWKTRELYVTSLYWSITTFATVGYGDIHSVSGIERASSALFMIGNSVLAAYITGKVTALVTRGSSRRMHLRARLVALNRFFFRHGVPEDLKRDMVEFLKSELATLDEARDVLAPYPSSIRADLMRYLYREMLRNSFLFKGCSIAFIDGLIPHMVQEVHTPGIFVFNEGDPGDALFILISGAVEVYVFKTNEEVKMGGLTIPGGVFGELGFLCEVPQPCSVVATSVTRLLVMSKASFTEVANFYHRDMNTVYRNLRKHLLAVRDEWHQGQLALVIEYSTARRAQNVRHLCVAAAQGDVNEIARLLEGETYQKDWQSADGYSPLHLAVAGNHEEAVVLLLEMGADADALDDSGISPLYEAVRLGHIAVADVLVTHGAQLHIPNLGTKLCGAVGAMRLDLLDRVLGGGGWDMCGRLWACDGAGYCCGSYR
eukprot:jgi/Mesvir1/29281/Mv12759-RA.2